MTDDTETAAALYRQQGMGQRIGFGNRPAVLIIDMQHDFCDPDAPTTLWPTIDTLLVCGTSVSGCVRATVTDAFMRDIRCMVIRECVADRAPTIMESNLFDMDQKYADVVSIADVLSYLDRFPLQN
jgi:nicotinamidase-related amidase